MTYSGKKQPVSLGNPPPLKQKKSRIFLKISVGFIGVLALLIILIVSVDLNVFREPVTEALSRATGMKIKIKFMDWSFSEGLKFKCKGVQILSGETEEELVSTKELLIKLKWLPLIQRQVVIKSITLVRPVLNISIKPPPRNDTLPPSENSSSDLIPNPSPLIKNKLPSPNWLHNVREFLMKPNLTLTEINLIAGQIVLHEKGATKEARLNAKARMRINREGSRVGLVLDGIELGMGNLMVQGQIHTDDFLSPNSPMRANIQIKPFKVSDLLPILQWAPESQNAINKKIKLKGDFHELNLKLKSPIEAMTDFDSFISSADAELILKGKKISLVQYGETISASTIEAAIQWIDQQWAHKIVLNMLGGNFETEGKIFQVKGSKDILDWTLDSHVVLDRINIHELQNSFFKQVAWFPKGGIINGKIHVQGPVLRPQLIRGEGTVNTHNVTLRLQGADVSIVGMMGSGRWLGDHLSHQFRLMALGGEISMKGNLNFKKNDQGHWDPVIDTEVIPQSIKLADLRTLVQKDWFPKQGTLGGKVHLQGPVLRPESMKGKGHLKVLNLKVKVKGTPVAVPITELKGEWANNRLNHDLKLKVFGGDIQVKGRLDLAKDRQGNRDPIINSKVFISPVSLTRLKPLVAQNWFPEKGVMDGTVHLRGPMLRPQALKAEGNLRIQNTVIPFEGQNINLAEIKGKGRWDKNHLRHQVQMKVFKGEVSVQGDLNFKKNNRGELDLIIDSEVIPQSIQLSSLRSLVQKDWFPEKGTLTGSVRLKGPVKRFSETILTGKLTGRKVILKIAEKPVVLEKTILFFEPNAQKNRLVGFNLSNISVGELSLKQSTGKVVFSNEAVELKQGKITPKTGVLLLSGTYKYETKDYKLNISGKGLRLEDFKEEYLEGPLNFTGNLYGGVLAEGFKKGLSGNIEIHSENGRVLKAGGILTKILNTLNLKLLQGVGNGLPFDSLGGDGTIKNGILSTENFKISSPSLKLWVSGKADLSEEKIDAEVIAIPMQRANKIFNKLNELMAKTQLNDGNNGILKKAIDKIPIIGDTLAGKEDEKGLLEGVLKMIPFIGDKRKEGEQPEGLIKVYFSIGGTFGEPNVYFLPKKTFMFK